MVCHAAVLRTNSEYELGGISSRGDFQEPWGSKSPVQQRQRTGLAVSLAPEEWSFSSLQADEFDLDHWRLPDAPPTR